MGGEEALNPYYYGVEIVSAVLLGVISLLIGVALVVYGFRGRRESQARDARTYRRGRL